MFNKCCSNQQEGHFYQIQTKTSNTSSKFVNVKDYQIAKDRLLSNGDCRVRQINKSQYDSLKNKLQKQKKQWTDPNFYPDDQRIGKQAQNKQIKWKRIADIIPNAVLYHKQQKQKQQNLIQSPIQQLYGSANLFTILSVIQNNSQILKQIFQEQDINKNGIYKIKLKIQGQLQQVLVDDFFPVDEENIPLFIKPKNGQIWMMLIEKARAKVYGSYQLMFQKANQPSIIFQQVLVAPVFQINFQKEQQKQMNWKLISSFINQKRFIVGMSKDLQKQLDILPNHLYSILQAKQFNGKDQKVNRVVKLKNYYNSVVWKGRANNTHNSFWDSISDQENKSVLFKKVSEAGTFLMLYQDLIECFSKLTISKYEKFANYFTEQLSFCKKNGKIYELIVKSKGVMHMSIIQSNFKLAQNKKQKCQASLLLFRQKSENYKKSFQLVNFYNKFNQQGTLNLQTHLTSGVYIIYCKLYPTSQNYYPQISKLLLYSSIKFHIQKSQNQHKNLLKRGFMSHAKNNKRQQYQDNLMWMSWKYFQDAGYGYIAFGVLDKCQKQLQITINQSDFIKSGFTLKKPYKNNKQDQIIKVKEGEQLIILVKKSILYKQKIKFPPKMNLQIKQKKQNS